ncbi:MULTISPECIES: ABC transporter ATP-binding protein [Clostridium]|uniref:ABC transporter ATP-binding protein n=1 Tax=Clostridium senegalense TaxID=1465809 RepID=A0A6M0H5P1_9CLOT|nr:MULTISPECIES: ABC transporter ATP-binding protein [Clostridium]NEU05618.1 ABC transporter ATP-binding protein [Clostridium senegalense]
MNNILKIKNVTKKYGTRTVLSNINFTMNEGEIIGLVGPNGAGKTTIMKIITGLTTKYDGEVFIQDENIMSMKKSKTKKVGCVIETPGLYPNLTGYENLEFFSQISGVKNNDEISTIVKMLGLEDAINKKVKTYSLGMRQRLGIAQAVLSYPPLLILDEPTNGLDPNVIIEIRKFIKYISEKKKTTVLISSHILSEIEMLCDRVIFMQKGEVIRCEDLKNKGDEIATTVFETKNIEEFKRFFKEKNIEFSTEDVDKVKIQKNKIEIQQIIKELINDEILFTSVYEEKESLEEKFMKTVGGDINV